MKKFTQLLIFLLPVVGFSQSVNEKIQTYLNTNHVKMGLSTSDVTGWIVESEGSSESTKINNYYIKQRVGGIEVFNGISNVWIKDNQVINVMDQFVPNANQKVNASTPVLSALDAFAGARTFLQVNNPGTFEIIETLGTNHFKISNGILTDDPALAELVYQLTPQNTLKLAWDFTFYAADHKHLWSIRVDAADGKIIDQHDMVISCDFGDAHGHNASQANATAFTKTFFKDENTTAPANIQGGSYRVIPYNFQSFNYSPRQLIVSPENATASPFGWHDTNGIAGNDFTITRGNNVLATDDADGNNGNGASPNGGAALVFDYPYGGTSEDPLTYLDAATTNLFYMNNIMHDVWYQYGFNEPNGNFQQKNYTGTGGATTIGGDAVQADAQDSRAVAADQTNRNNANFATPADGIKPRMQMYVWTVGPNLLFVTSPAQLAGDYQSVQNAFAPGHVDVPITPNFLQSDVVLYMDVAATTNEGCVAPANAAAMAGKIVLIKRGNCNFTVKVKNAQNAGAVAVIIADNIPNELVTMSGDDATITIPAIFITQGLGDAIIAQMATQPVNIKLSAPVGNFVNSDGDFDNGVIAHEYGHGISTRLTGGAANSSCLQNAEQAGEGWSDWLALMMQLKAGDVGASGVAIGTFVYGQQADGAGIRRIKYSTDLAVNPITFADSNDEESHNRGEVMATVLWDLTWAYINKYGFNDNIYTGTGGNNKTMRLVLDALKLQPCSPTFIEFRTALLAADQATTGGADYCTIWNVFARRGMGALASSGTRTNSLDQVEDFSLPGGSPNCALGVDYFQSDVISVYPNPSNGLVTIHIGQFTGKANIQVVDINGRVVFTEMNSEFNIEKTINLEHLQTGMYVLKVNGESLNYTKKIIIN